MGAFDYVFSLFGLLLGLSLAQILGGFARATKRHGHHRLGVLTPLLSIFLLYDISTFWGTAYRVRDVIPVHIAALIGGLAITGLYYFAAVLVWPEPDDAAAWSDLDDYMLTRKRQVLLSMIACNAASASAVAYLVPGSFHYDRVQQVLLTLYYGGMGLGAFTRGRKATLAVMILLVFLYVLDLVFNVTGA